MKYDGLIPERPLSFRYKVYSEKRQLIEKEGGLKKFCESYKEYGLHVEKDGTLVGTEWAPGAKNLYLRGNFNDWNNTSHPYKSVGFGKSPYATSVYVEGQIWRQKGRLAVGMRR